MRDQVDDVLAGVEAVLLEAAEVDGPPVEVVTSFSLGDEVPRGSAIPRGCRYDTGSQG